jgi:hypothetical protein
MTLDIPKRGRGRPKKIPELDTKNVIDIWVGGEPEPTTDPDIFLKGCAAAALIGLTFFLFALGIYAVGKVG